MEKTRKSKLTKKQNYLIENYILIEDEGYSIERVMSRFKSDDLNDLIDKWHFHTLIDKFIKMLFIKEVFNKAEDLDLQFWISKDFIRCATYNSKDDMIKEYRLVIGDTYFDYEENKIEKGWYSYHVIDTKK